MRGFLYTVIVMIIALSYMYVAISENSIQPIPSSDNAILALKNSYDALYGININDGNELRVEGSVGNKINIEQYKKVAANYGLLKNAGIDVQLEPDFSCGELNFGFDSFTGRKWRTDTGKTTELHVNASINAAIVNKSWKWALDDGDVLRISLRDNSGNKIIDEEGYINESMNNEIAIGDSDGREVKIALKDGRLQIEGDAKFIEIINDANCYASNNGYIAINGKKYSSA